MDGLHFLISLPLLMCIGQILLITAILPGKPIHGFVWHSSTLHSNKPCIRRKNYNGTGIQSHRGDLSTKFWHSMVYSRSWRFLYLYPSRFYLYPYASSMNIYRKPTWVNRTIRRRSLKVWNRQLHFLIPLTLFCTQSIVFIQNSLQKTPHNSRTNGYYGVFYPLFNDSLLLKN